MYKRLHIRIFLSAKDMFRIHGEKDGNRFWILEFRISDGSVNYSISHRCIVFDLIGNIIFLLNTSCVNKIWKRIEHLHPISLLMLTVIPEEISPAYFYLLAASCLTSSSIQSLLNRSFESTIRKILYDFTTTNTIFEANRNWEITRKEQIFCGFASVRKL